MVVVKDHQQREPSMGDITTIGLDLAKNVFQLHAVDEAGSVVMRKRLRRGQVLAFFARILRPAKARSRASASGTSLRGPRPIWRSRPATAYLKSQDFRGVRSELCVTCK